MRKKKEIDFAEFMSDEDLKRLEETVRKTRVSDLVY